MSWKSSMNDALAAINQQYADINNYYDQANTAFESQYKSYYGQNMTDTVNSMAQNDIFESPVSEKALNRQRQALTEQYATAKSTLAGEKMSALGSVNAQKISYYQNLASLQLQQKTAKRSGIGQLIGTGAGLAAMALI